MKDTLESVLVQSLSPDEILVVDDGSTDGTIERAEGYGGKVRVFRCSGLRQARARNFGAQQTTCEWIAFLDHDDLWLPNKLQRQMEELRANPAADLCYSACQPLVERGDRFVLGRVMKVPPADEIGTALYRNTVFLPGSVVIRRSKYLATGGFDPRFRLVEDWDYWLRLLHEGTVFVGCLEPFFHHRTHANNQSNQAVEALDEHKEIIRRHILPRVRCPKRWFKYARILSEHEVITALTLRYSRDPRYFSYMLRSVLRDPFHNAHRYKVLAHMFYTRVLKGGRR